MTRLAIIPLTFKQACDFVERLHRHHAPPRGHKFSIGVVDEAQQLRGVAIIGRPIARVFDDGLTAEVSRSCTDGTKNANSCLYAAAWRAARAMGYQRLITYTQEHETGVSLDAAGWRLVKTLAARKGWAESSQKLRHLRDPIGTGGVQRRLWEVSATTVEATHAAP